LRVIVAGQGTVEVPWQAIPCESLFETQEPSCDGPIPEPTTVKLIAHPEGEGTGEDTGFVGWSDADCPESRTCEITVDGDKSIVARFGKAALGVRLDGDGQVAFEGPDGEEIVCSTDCEIKGFPMLSTITLTASGAGGFDGWTDRGSCEAAGQNDTCEVTLIGYDWAGAEFAAEQGGQPTVPEDVPVHLVVTNVGLGSGIVTASSPSKLGEQIKCEGSGEVCRARYNFGERTTLTAQESGDSTFGGWEGAGGSCTTGKQCSFIVGIRTSVRARFTTVERADLAVTKTGSPSSVAVGETINYSIAVTNKGPATANGVTMTDVLPAGASFVSAESTRGTCNGTSTITCSVGSLVRDASATIRIVAKATAAGTLRNTAQVGPNQDDSDQGNNAASASTTVTSAPLQPPGGCTITGTPGNDTLSGTGRRDVICGRGGNDMIRAGAGADLVRAGTGRDIVYGGRGGDIVYGGPGADALYGEAARDQLYGGGGPDSIFGQSGRDLLVGGGAFDRLNGGGGVDECRRGGGGGRIINC
jgi:uncharacterized repeat protein (TIGR01451 family)